MKEFNVTQTTILRACVHNDETAKKTSENHFLHITWQYVGFCVAVCVREVGWVGRGKRVRDQQHRTRDLSYVLP